MKHKKPLEKIGIVLTFKLEALVIGNKSGSDGNILMKFCLFHKNLDLYQETRSFITILSGDASCKFLQLVDLQISVWMYTHRLWARRSTQGIENDPHRFCHLKQPCKSYINGCIFTWYLFLYVKFFFFSSKKTVSKIKLYFKIC